MKITTFRSPTFLSWLVGMIFRTARQLYLRQLRLISSIVLRTRGRKRASPWGSPWNRLETGLETGRHYGEILETRRKNNFISWRVINLFIFSGFKNFAVVTPGFKAGFKPVSKGMFHGSPETGVLPIFRHTKSSFTLQRTWTSHVADLGMNSKNAYAVGSGMGQKSMCDFEEASLHHSSWIAIAKAGF